MAVPAQPKIYHIVPSRAAVPIAQYARHARSLADTHARTLLWWV